MFTDNFVKTTGCESITPQEKFWLWGTNFSMPTSFSRKWNV